MKKVLTVLLLTTALFFTSCEKDGLFSDGCLNSYHNPTGCYIAQNFGIDEDCGNNPIYVLEATKNGKTYYINVVYTTWMNSGYNESICF